MEDITKGIILGTVISVPLVIGCFIAFAVDRYPCEKCGKWRRHTRKYIGLPPPDSPFDSSFSLEEDVYQCLNPMCRHVVRQRIFTKPLPSHSPYGWHPK